MNKTSRNLLMFILGCAFYTLVEMLWRGYSFMTEKSKEIFPLRY